MKPSITGRPALLASALALGMLVASFASCATNVGGDDGAEDASSSVPETGAPELDAGGDAGLDDASCEAADAGCTTEIAACETVSWCMVPTPVAAAHTLTAIWGANANDIWAVGSGGTIIHYDGAAWTATPTGYPNTFFAIWGSGPRDIWAVSSTDVILHGSGFRNGKAVWQNAPPTSGSTTEVAVISGRGVYAVWGSSPTDVRIGTRSFSMNVRTEDFSFSFQGTGNQFARSIARDGGVLWRALPGKEYSVTSIWGSSADDVWMTVDNGPNVPFQRGMTFHGTPYDRSTGGPNPNLKDDSTCTGCDPGCIDCALADDRLAWTPVDSQTTVALAAVWGSSADDVWAVGAQGTIRRIKAGDDRWRKVDSPTNESLHAVWGTGANDVWIAGDRGTILHYDGAKLEASSAQLPLGPRPNLRGIWGSGPDDVWIVGDSISLHYTGRKPGVAEGSGVK